MQTDRRGRRGWSRRGWRRPSRARQGRTARGRFRVLGPICLTPEIEGPEHVVVAGRGAVAADVRVPGTHPAAIDVDPAADTLAVLPAGAGGAAQIGRASCRERAWLS